MPDRDQSIAIDRLNLHGKGVASSNRAAVDVTASEWLERGRKGTVRFFGAMPAEQTCFSDINRQWFDSPYGAIPPLTSESFSGA